MVKLQPHRFLTCPQCGSGVRINSVKFCRGCSLVVLYFTYCEKCRKNIIHVDVLVTGR